MSQKITFGADPEFFAGYRKEGELYVMPPVIIRNEYDFPVVDNGTHPIFASYGETFVHEDGAAFEMSTPPSTSWKSIFNALSDAKEEFSKDVLSKFPEVCLPELFSVPTIGFEVEKWEDKGPEFRLSTLFGCDPDMDAFNTKSRAKVIDASRHPERYGGGHIHVSGIKEVKEQPLIAIRSMMLGAGLASIAFSDVPDLENKRLFLYGKPGKYRIQKYKGLLNGVEDTDMGVEYRTPSNRWTSDISIAEKVFQWVEISIYNLLVDGLYSEIADKVTEDALKAILTTDRKAAGQILSYIEARL